jgi:Tol biopolymer transport system component
LIRFNFTPGEYMKSLFVASADGTELRRLEGVGHKFHHHSWHPDGNRIIYGDLDEKGEFKLFLIDADGGNRRRVSETRLAGHPSVSPDGRTIVTDNYAGEFPDESKGDVFGDCLLLVDAATGEVEQLAGIRGKMKWLHAHPSWSRDGSQILYHSDHTGMSQIYVMPIDQ